MNHRSGMIPELSESCFTRAFYVLVNEVHGLQSVSDPFNVLNKRQLHASLCHCLLWSTGMNNKNRLHLHYNNLLWHNSSKFKLNQAPRHHSRLFLELLRALQRHDRLCPRLVPHTVRFPYLVLILGNLWPYSLL